MFLDPGRKWQVSPNVNEWVSFLTPPSFLTTISSFGMAGNRVPRSNSTASAWPCRRARTALIDKNIMAGQVICPSAPPLRASTPDSLQSPANCREHSACTIPSGPREVMRQLPLEFGEVTRDHRHVEASENRLLWLAVEQETEGRSRQRSGVCLPAVSRSHISRDIVTW